MLVSLDEAKDQLRILRSNTYFDNDIELKVQIASGILMQFCKLDEIPDEWYDESSPANVSAPDLIKGAVLMMTSELYLNRESSTANVLSDQIKGIIRLGYRDPTLA